MAATALVVGLGACGSGATSTNSASSPIVICEDVALSGPFAQLGLDDSYGVTAYAKMVNARGGMSGHKVTVVQENNQSVPATAATLARKCVTQDHASFVFGPEETGTATAAIPVLNSLRVVSLGWQSGWNAIGLSNADRHAYFFPGIENVFHEDDLATLQELVQPRHYTRVAVLETSSPGGLGNDTYTASLSGKYGFQVVKTEITPPGSTDDTPAVLALLGAKPQLIMLGLTPGPDSITGIRAIRAQNPTIPISECSGCEIPSFIAAAGGPSAMQNVYLIGGVPQLAGALPNNPANAPTVSDVNNYVAAMKAAGLGAPNVLLNGLEGWDTSEELAAAIKAAGGSTSEAKVQGALQHQRLDTLGIQWVRTPSNYGAISAYQSVMDTVAPDGSLQVIGTPSGGPGE